jgi:cell division septal protein FtsQ
LAIDRTRRQRKNAVKAAVKRIVTVLVISVLIVASMYAYGFLTTSEIFAIHDVEFTGMSRVDTDEIEEQLADLKGQNILLVSLDAYAERIRTHPRVERVSMKRVLPDKVACAVVEREPVALVFTDQFLEVDRHGMVMADDEYTAVLDLPIITGLPKSAVEPGKINDDSRLRNALHALALCKSLGGDFAEDISELRVSPGGLSIRSLAKDRMLILGDADYANRLHKYFLLKETLADNEPDAGVIDLRFDNQVVLRGRM